MLARTRPSHRRPAAIAAAVGAAILLLSACNLIGGEPQELLVLEWSGYEADDFNADFIEANPEATLEWEYGSSDADILALMQGGSQADVFHFYTGWQQFYVDEGLVMPIDTSKLTNWDAVSEEYAAMGQIDGVQYFIPWDIGYSSILYNTEQVPEVTSWDALLNPEYTGHISMWDDGPAAVTVSSYIHGYDETAITDEQLADIEAEWLAQKPLNLHYWDSEYDNLCPEVISGEIWVAYAWQGCYSAALAEGAPVAYAIPDEGRNSWAGLYGISAETDSPELAHEYLDMKLAELTCSNVVNLYYYGCPRQDVMDGIEDEFIRELLGLDNPSILENTNFTPIITPEQRDAWTAMWTRVKAD